MSRMQILEDRLTRLADRQREVNKMMELATDDTEEKLRTEATILSGELRDTHRELNYESRYGRTG